VGATIVAVDAGAGSARVSNGRALGFDALVLAVAAEAVAVVAHATTWDDRADAETLGGLLRDIEEGYSRRLAIVIPPRPAWPLRAYQLALFMTLQARGMAAELETTIVAPLAVLGSRAVELVSDDLVRAGVAVVSADRAEVKPGHASTLVLSPGGRRLEVDRVLALPGLRGRAIAGVPADADGFVEVDERCRARAMKGVWAVGDASAFAVKSGGFAAEQADVAAHDIAALAGADTQARPFDPNARENLAGLPTGPYFRAWLAQEDQPGLTTGLPATGVPILTYLQRDLEAGPRSNT
jgi:sulfide:quinone oxidoreductase